MLESIVYFITFTYRPGAWNYHPVYGGKAQAGIFCIDGKPVEFHTIEDATAMAKGMQAMKDIPYMDVSAVLVLEVKTMSHQYEDSGENEFYYEEQLVWPEK